MPGSVSIKSTGQKASSTSSSDQQMDHADPGNPHPMVAGLPKESYGSMGSGAEYREVPSAGITETGVGSGMPNNDAANETITKHPAGSRSMNG